MKVLLKLERLLCQVWLKSSIYDFLRNKKQNRFIIGLPDNLSTFIFYTTNISTIRCNRVEVSIYRSCSARMHLFECSVSEKEDPEGPFQASNKQRKFVNRLQRSSLYFHFNNAEVSILSNKFLFNVFSFFLLLSTIFFRCLQYYTTKMNNKIHWTSRKPYFLIWWFRWVKMTIM